MGCDWYNDSDESAKLVIQLRAKAEDSSLHDSDSITLTVPPNGRVYMEEAADSEVKRR